MENKKLLCLGITFYIASVHMLRKQLLWCVKKYAVNVKVHIIFCHQRLWWLLPAPRSWKSWIILCSFVYFNLPKTLFCVKFFKILSFFKVGQCTVEFFLKESAFSRCLFTSLRYKQGCIFSFLSNKIEEGNHQGRIVDWYNMTYLCK